jgi:hypothetical protein
VTPFAVAFSNQKSTHLEMRDPTRRIDGCLLLGWTFSGLQTRPQVVDLFFKRERHPRRETTDRNP